MTTKIFYFETTSDAVTHGLGSYSYNLLTSLSKIKGDFSLFRVSIKFDQQASHERKILNDKQTDICITLKSVENLGKPEVVILPSVARGIITLLSDFFEPSDKIIFHLNTVLHLSIAEIAKAYDFKVVYTNHILLWRVFYENNKEKFLEDWGCCNRKGKRNRHYSSILAEKKLCKIADEIISLSMDCKKFMETYYDLKKRNRIHLVYNGLVQKENLIKEIEVVKKELGYDKRDFIFLYVGRLIDQKGIIGLINAFLEVAKIVPSVRLLIVGTGNFEKYLSLSSKCCGKITFTGYVSKEDVQKYYAIADVGVIPSITEQCSFTALEMLQEQLPLIVSDIPGFEYPFVDNENVIKTKVNIYGKVEVTDLVNKMKLLATNPMLLNKMKLNSKILFENSFTAEKMAKKTLAIYNMQIEEEGYNEEVKFEIQKTIITKPLVSIVIPCYNAEKYLQECLDSIYMQSFPNFEIILINDGSNDSTEEIIKKQNDGCIIYLKNEENLGVALTLNKGISFATGKYIARMDADDTMQRERLQQQVTFLEANPTYGLVGSWHNATDASGLPIRQIRTLEEHDEISLNMLFYNPISHPTVMLRSELAKANPYNVEFSKCEDYELWFRLAEQTKIKNLQKALVNYRTHQNSTVVQHQKEMQQNVMELLSNQLEQRGIEHTPQELVLHCAIGFGMGKRYFNSPERITDLHNWLDKIFGSKAISKNYPKTKLKKFRKELLENFCGLAS